jgi:hypothetical protein
MAWDTGGETLVYERRDQSRGFLACRQLLLCLGVLHMEHSNSF